MTPTEKGRRVDALNQGPDTRRVLCEMVANREGDLEDAQAENAALREECDGWKKLCVDQEIMHVMHEDALDNENAKLRELCADMFKLAGEGYVPFEDADDWMARDGDIERRMRELGVEVNL